MHAIYYARFPLHTYARISVSCAPVVLVFFACALLKQGRLKHNLVYKAKVARKTKFYDLVWQLASCTLPCYQAALLWQKDGGFCKAFRKIRTAPAVAHPAHSSRFSGTFPIFASLCFCRHGHM